MGKSGTNPSQINSVDKFTDDFIYLFFQEYLPVLIEEEPVDEEAAYINYIIDIEDEELAETTS